MSSLRGHIIQDVEDPPTNEDNDSVVLDDTYSINSDATRLTITPLAEDSYSVINSEAISTLPPVAQPATASRWSRILDKLCCWRKRNHSAENLSTNSCQSEIDLRKYVEKLEEIVKTCQVSRCRYAT